MPLNHRLKGIDLEPQQHRREGQLLGAIDEGVAGGLKEGVDQEYFVELFAGPKAGAHDYDVSIRIERITQWGYPGFVDKSIGVTP